MPPYHQSGVGWTRTRSLRCSLTVASFCSGPMTGSCQALSAVATISARLALRMRISHRHRVGRARPGVQLVEDRIIEHARLAFGDRALLVVLVAEDDGLRRAGLLAGGLHRVHRRSAVLLVPLDDRLARALDAVGAFLHDAAVAHRHI